MRPLFAITLLAWSPAARAQEPRSAVARCADAAAGNEVEVCLLLAAENPDQVDGIAAALHAHIARAGSADQDLLLALLALIDDRTALDAAQRMAELGDPRALPALAACAERRGVEVASSCLRAHIGFAEGVAHLAPWLIDETRPLALRQVAATTLGEAGTREAGDALIDALRRPRLAPPIRKTILDTIRAAYPDRVAELQGEVASDGRMWLAVGGGWGMGYAMGAAGYFGQTDLAALGWATGVVGGGTAGWLYGRAWPMEAGDASYIATGGILGTSSGMLIGAGVDSTDADGLYAGGLVGLAVGYGTTALTRNLHPGSGADSAEATGIATMTSVGALAIAQTAQANLGSGSADPDALALASGLGLASGTAIGHGIAPAVHLKGVDAGLIAIASGWGLAAGSLVPLGPEADRASAPVVGLAAGSLVGYGLAAPLDLAMDVQGAAVAGALYGGTFGAGLGLAIAPEGQAPRGLALGIGTAGMVAGGVLAHRNPDPLDDRDVAIVALTTSWTVWQSAGWAAVAEGDQGRIGLFVMAPAVVGAGTALATPKLDVPVPQAVAATSVGLWGAYGGGVAAELTGNDVLTWSLVGSDIGVLGGAVVMSPLVGAPPVVIGVADAGGVAGGSIAALGTAFATSDGETILTASLIGAGVGFASGAALGSGWKKGGTRDMARRGWKLPGRWAVRPDMGPERTGLALDVTEW